MRSRVSLLIRVLPASDGLITALLYGFVLFQIPVSGRAGLILSLLVVPLWVSLFRYFGLYGSHRVETLGLVIRKILSAHLVGGLVLESGLSFVTSSAKFRTAQFIGASAVVFVVE